MINRHRVEYKHITYTSGTHGWLAQLAERVVHTDEVTGSSPVPPTTFRFVFLPSLS